jgi:hypothetical protein
MDDPLTHNKFKGFPYKPAMRVRINAPNPPSILINSSTGDHIISSALGPNISCTVGVCTSSDPWAG